MALRTGPFVNVIHSAIPAVSEAIALLYSNHPIEDSSGFADFHVSIKPATGVRRWLQYGFVRYAAGALIAAVGLYGMLHVVQPDSLLCRLAPGLAELIRR